MPYLAEAVKHKFENITCQIVMSVLSKPGELNYLFTRLIQRYIKCQGESYTTYNDVIGALEACKLELYRRRVSWYEELKITENGDVYNDLP